MEHLKFVLITIFVISVILLCMFYFYNSVFKNGTAKEKTTPKEYLLENESGKYIVYDYMSLTDETITIAQGCFILYTNSKFNNCIIDITEIKKEALVFIGCMFENCKFIGSLKKAENIMNSCFLSKSLFSEQDKTIIIN